MAQVHSEMNKLSPRGAKKVAKQKKHGAALTKPPRAPGAPPPVRKPPPAPVVKTIQQMAHELVQAQLLPYYQQLKTDEQAQHQSERERQAAVQGFTASMVNLLKGQPAAIQGDYNNAIAQTGALAQQSADALRAANPNTENQALLAAINAPAEQRAKLEQLGQQVFGGGAAVLQHTQGTLPGTTLAGNELAQLVHARNLPSIAAAQGTQALRAFLAQAAGERDKLAHARGDLRNQIPGLEMQTRMGLEKTKAEQDAANAKAQADAAAAAWDHQFKLAGLKQNADIFAATYGLDVSKLNTSTRLKETDQKLRAAQMKIDADLKLAGIRLQSDRYKVLSLTSDRNYQVAMSKLGIAGAAEQRKAAELQWKMDHPKTKGGFTAGQKSKLSATAFTIASNGRSGFTDKAGVVHPPLSIAKTFEEMLKEGVPPSIAQKAINRYWPVKERAGAAKFWKTISNIGWLSHPKAGSTADSVPPSTGGGGNYVSPIPQSAKMMKIDSGVDFQGAPGDHVTALGDALVTSVRTVGGYGRIVAYKLLSGPMKGRYVFVAHAEPTVRKGQRLRAGDSVAMLKQHAYGLRKTSPHSPGWVEMGFAAGPDGMPLAYKDLGVGWSGPSGDPPTTRGQEFYAFLQQLGA